MAANKTNTGLWLGLGLLGFLTAAFFYVKNKDRKETQNSDRTTEDIADRETAQALQLFNMLGVTNMPGIGWRLATFHNIPEEQVLNLLLSVTDWKKLQEKFRGLCNNEYSLTKALSDGLNADEYRRALQYAGAQKVVTTLDTSIGISGDNVVHYVSVPAGTLVGALTGDGGQTYSFINAVDDDGDEVKAFCYKIQAKLI